jgi:hypothetical protein
VTARRFVDDQRRDAADRLRSVEDFHRVERRDASERRRIRVSVGIGDERDVSHRGPLIPPSRDRVARRRMAERAQQSRDLRGVA